MHRLQFNSFYSYLENRNSEAATEAAIVAFHKDEFLENIDQMMQDHTASGKNKELYHHACDSNQSLDVCQ